MHILGARNRDTAQLAEGGALRGAVAQAAAFTFLNPHVYLDTVLLMGSIGARLLAPLFSRPRAWQILDILVGATMLALAAGLVQQTLGR